MVTQYRFVTLSPLILLRPRRCLLASHVGLALLGIYSVDIARSFLTFLRIVVVPDVEFLRYFANSFFRSVEGGGGEAESPP